MRERRRARPGESGARTREDRREWAGRGRWRNGGGPIVRARSRSPGHDVTNFLCFLFIEARTEGFISWSRPGGK
jgi:hypothetical protein